MGGGAGAVIFLRAPVSVDCDVEVSFTRHPSTQDVEFLIRYLNVWLHDGCGESASRADMSTLGRCESAQSS